jgi:hypothetical protein
MASAVFEPAVPASERTKTYALDRAATGIGMNQVTHVMKHILKCRGPIKLTTCFGIDVPKHVVSFILQNAFIKCITWLMYSVPLCYL